MDTRQQLVEEWKAKLAASEQTPAASNERFAWVRQIYTRIYRFLVSYYGDGEWRGDRDDSSPRANSQSTVSRMPFVECVPPSDGLLPKSPERIRATLESIHDSNPGIATAGTMGGVEVDSWVIVDAQKKSQYARVVHQRLVACGIETRLLHRTTDMAVVVRHEDFQDALAVVQAIGRPRQIRIMPGLVKWSLRPEVENVGQARRIRISKRVDPRSAVGAFLLLSTVLAFLAFILLNDTMPRALPFAICALWIAGLASGWLYLRGRRLR